MNLKIKKIIIFIFFISSSFSVNSRLISTFSEILKPTQLSVNAENIYIVQDYSVFIFSRKDFKLKKRIGSKGEGPGEFRLKPRIIVLKNGFILKSFSKFIHYAKNGSIIKEKNFFSSEILDNVFFIKDLYVIQNYGISEKLEYKNSISIFGKDINLKKLIIQQKYKRKDRSKIQMLRPRLSFKCYKGKIFVVSTKNVFEFTIFNSEGTRLNKLNIKYTKIPVDEKFKKNYLEKLLSTYSKDQKKIIKKKLNLIFPKYFPPLIDFYIDHNRIFVKTYEKKEELDYNGLVFKTIITCIIIFENYINFT